MKNKLIPIMAIRVEEFSNGGYKTSQHTERKLMNFENWVNGGLEVFKNQSFKSQLFSSSQEKNTLN